MTMFDVNAVAKIQHVRIDPDKHDFSSYLGFTDRNGYLQWISSWKHALQQTIDACRKAKLNRKTSLSSPSDNFDAQGDRERMRIKAYNLFLIRSASKLEAARQWSASRNSMEVRS